MVNRLFLRSLASSILSHPVYVCCSGGFVDYRLALLWVVYRFLLNGYLNVIQINPIDFLVVDCSLLNCSLGCGCCLFFSSSWLEWTDLVLIVLYCFLVSSNPSLPSSYYYQFSSSVLAIPIGITTALICFCLPGLIRSFHHLIPSFNILSDASSFPLYILFHDLLPLPFLRILSLGKKIFDLVYFVQEVYLVHLVYHRVLILFVELLVKYVSFLLLLFLL